MNPLAILLGGAAGWYAAGYFDKKPLFRGVIAFSGAYVANIFANAAPAQAAPPLRAAPRAKASAPAGSSDTLSNQNIAASPELNDTGGGGSNF